jgi:hypothetical protein
MTSPSEAADIEDQTRRFCEHLGTENKVAINRPSVPPPFNRLAPSLVDPAATFLPVVVI